MNDGETATFRAGSRAAGPSTWTWPIGIAVSMALGLVSALLGDGVWDMLSWFALGGPLVVAGWLSRRRIRR